MTHNASTIGERISDMTEIDAAEIPVDAMCPIISESTDPDGNFKINLATLIDSVSGGVGVTDGDKGDIVVTSDGTVWSFDSSVVTAFARTFLDDASATAVLATLGITLDTDVTLAANSDTRVATQKAVKAYVDAAASGLSWKTPVRVATTAAGTLASDFENGDTVDGVVLATGDRILIKNQAAATENGIYTVNASGAPTRATDLDAGSEFVNAAVFASAGTANHDTQWTCTNDSAPTLGVDDINWVQIASGNGLLQASNNLSDVTNAVTAGSNIRPVESLIIACSDETTAITTGTAKVTFRMPYAFTLTEVRASVTTAPTGSTIIIDINESGTTILSTKLSIDAGEKTSTTAASAAVISDTSLADDAEMTIDFDQVGSTVAGTGVKVTLIGNRT